MSARACVVHAAADLRIDTIAEVPPAPGEVAIDVALGGICGSDLHYYRHGAVGAFRIAEPMVLGHEVVGRVAATGADVEGLRPGDPVAIHPATPCGDCAECSAGHRNVCPNVRYLGSAARRPHVQGGFSQRINVPRPQVRVLPPGLALERAVLAEPLSVALHAIHRAGDVAGKRVLITGAGPIGLLIIAALRRGGTSQIIVSDVLGEPLVIAAGLGATETIRADRLESEPIGSKFVDIAIEASGSVAALATCLRQVRRAGRVVMVGMPSGSSSFAADLVIARELELVGSFRFDEEFDIALALLADGLDVSGIVSHRFALEQAQTAFELAGDRTRACKVLLEISP